MVQKTELRTVFKLITLTVAVITFDSVVAQQDRPSSFVHYNLGFKLIVKYPEAKLTSNGLSTQLYIVGNGLGLQWNQPRLLTKEVGQDTWFIDFLYNSTSDGYVCSNCANQNLIPVHDNFEYRILTSNQQDMIGANFGLNLQMSKAETYFQQKPTFYAYPFFFTRVGEIRCVNVTSANDFINTREWCYYLPPSFNENVYKTYKTAVSFDLAKTYLAILQNYLDAETINGIIDETLFVGSEDYRVIPEFYDLDRTELLSPSVSASFTCKEGNVFDGCNGCIPSGVTGREYQQYLRDSCGVPIYRGGYGEQYLDHVVKEVLPTLQSLLGSNRLPMDRERLGIGGCSLGGLLACHAMWTRPETFAYGACQSTSFWWPMVDHQTLDNGFEFLNVTLKTRTGLRYPQRVYIDVAELEDDAYYAQVYAALKAFDTIPSVSPYSFRQDVNLKFVLAENQSHCDDTVFARAWLYMSDFNKPLGGPKNPLLSAK